MPRGVSLLNQPFTLGGWRADPRQNVLEADGRRVRIDAKAMRVLTLLVERAGKDVTKEELLQVVWDGAFVGEQVLTNAIWELRKALDDDSRAPTYILTIPRKGYRFIGPVRLEDRATRPATEIRPAGTSVVLMALVTSALVAGALVWLARLPSNGDDLAESPPRVVPLTALEGFERNPSLSPDGEQVAYDHGPDLGPRHIYVQSIATGRKLELTDGDVRDHSPDWSPNGQEIAFVRDTAEGHVVLVVSALGGPSREIARSAVLNAQGGVSFSPDGELLAMVDRPSTEEPTALFLVSLDSGDKRQITFPQPMQERATRDRQPAFSPDGGRIAFVRTLAGSGGSGWIGIYTLESDQTTLLSEDEAPPGFLWDVDWATDGLSVLYSLGTTFDNSWVARAAIGGGSPSRLSLFDRARGITGNENRIIYSQWLEDTNIWRRPGPASDLSTPAERLIASTRNDHSAELSPDGSQIAFISSRTGTWEVWVADVEGRDARQLTDLGHAIFPRWSPDGKRIAFSSVARGYRGRLVGYSDLYVVASTGGVPRNVTDDAFDEAIPSWSRDGEWLYFQSNRVGNVWQVWKQPIDGGEMIQLTVSETAKFIPQEMGDGRIAYLAADRLWSVSSEGGDETRLLDEAVPVDDFSATGRHVAFLRRGADTLEVLDIETGEIRTLASSTGVRWGGFNLSRDGQWVLYGRTDTSGADLMLVENPR